MNLKASIIFLIFCFKVHGYDQVKIYPEPANSKQIRENLFGERDRINRCLLGGKLKKYKISFVAHLRRNRPECCNPDSSIFDKLVHLKKKTLISLNLRAKPPKYHKYIAFLLVETKDGWLENIDRQNIVDCLKPIFQGKAEIFPTKRFVVILDYDLESN